MKANSIVNTLYEMQLNGEINLKLIGDQQYIKADSNAVKKLQQLKQMGLTKKQLKRLEDVIGAYNNSAIEFARIAYWQGMADCFQLLQELRKNSDYEDNITLI